jgi:sugar phosphate isomerase/epimerase
MIDYERVIKEFSDKLFHVHAKDLHVDRDGLYNNGVLAQGMGWQIPRLPGLGDVDWAKFIGTLKSVGYDYVVSIEHEDRNYEGDEELVKKGFYLSRDVLKPLMQ